MANMSFTNNAASTLTSSLSSGATSLTVATGTGALFPTLTGSQYFYCTLANTAGNVEIVKVTARSSDTFTIVRGQDNTSAVAWNSGDKVELRLVAASLNKFPKLDEANIFSGANVYGTPTSITLTNGTGLPLTTGVTGVLPVVNGGTGRSSLGVANQLLGVNASGTAYESKSVTPSTGISITHTPGAFSITNTGVTSVNGHNGSISAAQIATAATAGYGYTPISSADVVSTDQGATDVGSFAFLQLASVAYLNPNSVVSGSSLRFSGITEDGVPTTGAAPAGSWRLLGRIAGSNSASLFQRVI